MDEVEVAVMLADISGSTALYEDVGNAKALRLVSECLELLRTAIEKHGGEFISSKGDDVLCIFRDPQAALDVGIEVLEDIREGPLSLHAGIDFGPVIRTEDDVFGDSVNMAARLSTLARSGEIICSDGFYERLKTSHRSVLRFFGARQFKGRAEPSNVYLFSDALPGQTTEIVFMEANGGSADGVNALNTGGVKAALRLGPETYVSTSRRAISLGRSVECDVVVPLPWVSRSHAMLEVLQEKVYLTDTSTSGTYVCFDGQPPLFVRREMILLPSSCSLSLARSPGDAGAQEIICDVLQPSV